MITSAAVQVIVNDRTITMKVHRHCDAFEILSDFNINYNRRLVKQGFIDYDPMHGERFVDRREALVIARKNNQLLYPDDTLGELFSEDLW